MTRVGTFSHHQMIVQEMLRNQSRNFESQRRVASGQNADHFKDISRETPALLGAKSIQTRLEGYQRDNVFVGMRLDTYNVTLQSLEGVAQSVRKSVFDALSTGSSLEFADAIEAQFGIAVGLLNTRLDGKAIFGGTNTGVDPVNISSVTELLALAEPPSAAFSNNSTKPSAKIDDTVTMDYGVLADEVGQDLFEAIQRILLFNSGTLPTGAGAFAPAGAFNDPMDANQIEFLTNELARLETVTRDLAVQSARNGIHMNQLEETDIRQEMHLSFTVKFITEIEDTDMAEAVANLNQDQVALDVSMAMLSRVSQTTLLDFL